MHSLTPLPRPFMHDQWLTTYSQAVEHFKRSKNHEMTAQSLAMVGDFDGLDALVGTLPDHDPTLLHIGAKFEAFGRSQSAVGAYAKAGAVRRLAVLQLPRSSRSTTDALQLPLSI